jgi:tetratricopeptide (TPR) repeat protein
VIIALSVSVAGCGGTALSSAPGAASQGPPASGATSPSASPSVHAAPGASVADLPTATIAPTQAEIVELESRVATDPEDAGAQRDLGLALLQRIRETADPSLYAPAEAALDQARRLAPDDILALVGIGGLQLGRHQFAEALATGTAAVAAFPGYAPAHGVLVDALVELGRYKEAVTEVDRMVALSSDLASLARLSYVRELHGDLAGALKSMQQAAASPGLATENTAFVTALVGNLLVANGHPDEARSAYEAALAIVPAHAPSIAGLGRLAVGAGDLQEARARFQQASDILPLPEYVIALGEVDEALGDPTAGAKSYALARAEIQLFQASGVMVDVDLALFEADHGDPSRSLELATAGYALTPTTRAADALAWALHRLGRDEDAAVRSKEALRLGSKDPLLRYHAGAIEAALGQKAAARRDLEMALATDPGFSAIGAAEARRILATLDD